MIDAIATAIMGLYNTTPGGDALRAVLTGGLWFSQAKPDVSYPYSVFTWVGSTIDEICGGTTLATHQSNRIEKATIDIDIFSNADDGGAEIFSIADKMMDLFDWCTLSITGYTFIAMRRISIVNLQKADRIWMVEIQYELSFLH